MTSRRALGAVVAGLLLAASACGTGGETTLAPPQNSRLSTDRMPVPEASEPGDLIDVRPLAADIVPQGAVGWEVVYRSTDVHGEPVEVSGHIWAPNDPVGPDDERPVVTWAHPPTGGPDHCAPDMDRDDVPYLEDLIAAGYVVTATKYVGQGTDDVHIAMAGKSAAADVLDIVRAARNIDGAAAGDAVVAYGHSQGAHAVLFAGIESPYAPELDLRGIVATSPPIDLSIIMTGSAAQPAAFGFYVQVAMGFAQAYEDLEMEELFTPEGVERADIVWEQCSDEVVAAFADAPIEELITMPPHENEKWRARFAENDASARDLRAPALILHGADDKVLMPVVTEVGVQSLCAAGNTIEYHRVPGGTDENLYRLEKSRILDWIAARFEGKPPTSTC